MGLFLHHKQITSFVSLDSFSIRIPGSFQTHFVLEKAINSKVHLTKRRNTGVRYTLNAAFPVSFNVCLVE